MLNKQLIVDEAKTWLNVKWQHQGRTKRGVDCAGLVFCVGNDLKLMDYDFTQYGRRTSGQAFLHHFRDNMNMDRVDNVANRQSGDVLLLRDFQFPCHCGIFERDESGQEWAIHAAAPKKKVVRDRYSDPDIEPKLIAVFRWRGVE